MAETQLNISSIPEDNLNRLLTNLYQRLQSGTPEQKEYVRNQIQNVTNELGKRERDRARASVENNSQKANQQFSVDTNADKPVTVPAETVKPKPVETATAEEEIKPVPTPDELNKPEETTPVQGTTTTNQFEQEVNKELGQQPSTAVNMPAQTITATPKINSGKTYDLPSSAVAPADGGEPPKTGNEAWESVNGRMQVNNTGENRKDNATANADTIALRDYFQANLGRAPTSEEYERIRTQGSTVQSVMQESQNPTQGQTDQQNTPTTQTDQEVANRQPANTAEDIPPNPFDTISGKPTNTPSKPTTADDIPPNPIPETTGETDGLPPPPLPEDIQDTQTGEQIVPPPQLDNQGQPIDTSGMMQLGEDIQRTTDASKDAVFQATAKGLGMQGEREAEARESGLSLTDYRQQVEDLLDTSKKEGKESLRKMMAGLDRNEKRAFAQNLIYALGSIAAGLTGLQQGVAVGQYYKPEKVFNQSEADAREQNKYSADMEQQKQDLTLQLSKAKDLFDITQKYLDPAASAQLAQMAKGYDSTTQGNQTIQNFIAQRMQNDTAFQQELTKLKLAQDWGNYAALRDHRYQMELQALEQKAKGSTASGAKPEPLSDKAVEIISNPIRLSGLPRNQRWTPEAKTKYMEQYKATAEVLTPSDSNVRYMQARNNLSNNLKKGLEGLPSILDIQKQFSKARTPEEQAQARDLAANAISAQITKAINGDLGSGVDVGVLREVTKNTLLGNPELVNALATDSKGVKIAGLQAELFDNTAREISKLARGIFNSPRDVVIAEKLGFLTGLPTDEELNNEIGSLAQLYGVPDKQALLHLLQTGYRGDYSNQGQQTQGQQRQPRQRQPVNLIPSVADGDKPKNNQTFMNIVDSTGSPVKGQYQGITLNQVQPTDKMRPGLQQGQYILPEHMTQDKAFLQNVAEIAKSTGGVMDEKALLTLMAVENISGLPNVINMAGGNKSTGATGLFQFLPATIFPYLKEKGVMQGDFDYDRRAEIQNTMANLTRTQQTAIFSDFLQDMLSEAQSVYPAGTKLTPGHIYAIHNQGAQGVRNMLRGQSASNRSGNAGLDLSNINNLINDFNRRIPESFTNSAGQPVFGGG